MTGASGRAEGWRRLWWHSYRLGARWAVRDARSGWKAGRTGWVRLLVPLDPWRYYELGRLADEDFTGRCLDIASPKLLPSLMQHEGNGSWVGTDLFSREIEAWKRVDPTLELEVQDATQLAYADQTFDHVVCISVLEHIGRGKDEQALREMWRVLKSGGILHLTTDIALEARDVYLEDQVYGEASTVEDGRVFFKHDYTVAELDDMLDAQSWATLSREFAVQVDPELERRFYDRAPWSYVYGPLLRVTAPGNFAVSATPDVLRGNAHGVIYLRLKKTADGVTA